MRNALLWLVAVSASFLYGQQALDNTGNSYLNGSYFFRWVVYSSLDSKGMLQATAAYGTIRFDGAGTYRIEGRIADSTTAPVTSRPFTPTGRYTVSASGMAEIENPIFPGDTLYAGVGPAGVVGSSTGHGNHDLFIAIPSPASSVTNGDLAGVYRAATFDFLHGSTGGARDAFLSLQADGKGNFAPFAPVGSSADGLAASSNQTVTGATYSLAADGSGTAAFPLSGGNADARLVAGNKIFFLSSDGETFIAGSPTGFDFMVGIRALSGEAANAAYRGLYYTASIQHDVRSTPYYQSLRGARNVQAASTWYQERINAAPDIPANHYDGTDTVPLRPFDSDGVYRDTNFYRVVGTGGRIFLEVGRGNFYELYLGVRAHPFAGGGSFLSPYGVVNGANFQPATNPIAPGEIVSLFGSGFATSSTNASSVPLPTTLGDVQVKINGRPAPLLSVGPEQINLVVPHATTEPNASVQVFVSGRPLKAVGAYTRATAPGVFTIPPGGTDGGAVLHTDYSLVSETSGARPGETVMAFVTGLGAVTPALADGTSAPASPFSVVPPSTKVSVYVGGIPATVSFAGLAPGFAGLYQLNFRIPDNIGAVFPKGDSGSAFAPVEVGTVDGATLTRLRVDPRPATAPKVLAASAANTAPTAEPQAISTSQNTSAFINLTATDLETPAALSTYASHSSAPHGAGSATGLASAVLTFAVVSHPAHGTLTGTPPNLVYTPAPNYAGPDNFQFTATDHGNPENCGTPGDDCTAPLLSPPATVSITVLSVNTRPSANSQTAAVSANAASAITLAGSDAETPADLLSFAVITAPAHGTLSGIAPNLTYRPTPGYSGPDSFQFTVTDRGQPDNCGAPSTACAAALTSGAGTVSINVGPLNTAPTAISQSLAGAMATPLSFTLTGSDTETPANALVFRVVSQPQDGSLTVNGSSVIYTPNSRFHGEDSFRFTVTDRGSPDNCGAPSAACAPPLTSNPAVISISISGPVPSANTAPQAHAQTVTTNENTAKAIVLTGADAETPAADLAFAVTVNPAHGSLSGTAPNLTYTPAPNYIGADSFQFKSIDRGSPDTCGDSAASCAAPRESAPATVSITVVAVNTAPVAAAQAVAVNEGAAKTIALAGTDAETAAASLAFAVTSAPAHGTLAGTAPNVTYTPAAGYFGRDSFQFTVTDRGNPDRCGATGNFCAAPLTSSPGLVSLTVVPVNTAPIATVQNVVADENSPRIITLAGTDTDTPAAGLSFTVTGNPAHGTLTGTAPNLTYTPAANYIGPDSFQFTVTDRGKPDNCGASGSACAAALTSAAATVSITVRAANTPPSAIPQSASTNENKAKAITLDGADSETAAANLVFAVTAAPAHGTLSGTAPHLTYTPNAGYSGPDSFQFTVTDRGAPDNCGAPNSSCAAPLTSSAATVTLAVIPVNSGPTATPQSITTNENVAKAVALAGTDTETLSGNLSFTVTANPAHGTLTGTAPNLTYTPAANYVGPDSFQFTVTDRGKPDNCGAPGDACAAALTSTPATVTISVQAVNTPPVANALGAVTNENVAIPIILTASDAETAPSNLTFTVTAAPAHGIITGSAPNLVYTPLGGFFGVDAFQFKVRDLGNPDNCGAPGSSCAAALESSVATVTITVVPVNTAPAATAQSITAARDSATAITLAGTDAETAPANLAFNVTASPTHGTLSGTAPHLTYTPAANYTGPDSFQFTVTDRGKPDNCGAPNPGCSGALTSAATVSITVAAINRPPVASALAISTNENTPVPVPLTGSDTETAAANLIFAVTTPPSHGTLSGTAPNLTYTPAPGYFGPDSFQFKVTDRGAPDNCGAPNPPSCLAAVDSAPATVSITVAPVNTAPLATAQSVTTNQDTQVSILIAGTDAESATLSFTVTSGAAHGTLTGTAPNLTYSPNAGYFGPDSFQFTVTDGGKPDNCGSAGSTCAAARSSAAATVSITVVPVNTAPTATPQSVNTNESTAKAITLTGSDLETAPANLSFAVTTGPSHGSLSGVAPNLTYTPAAGYFGPDSFQFTVTDLGHPANCGAAGTACAAARTSSAATVGIIVSPLNTPPTATSQALSANQNAGTPVTLAGTDTETAAASLSFTITTGPSHSVLTGLAPNLTYTPTSNYVGPDSFQFTVTDRGKPDGCGVPGAGCAATLTSAPATVSIMVVAANTPPTASAQSVTTAENAAAGITLSGTDSETTAANLSFAVTVNPSHGTLTGAAPNLTYTPNANYNGADSFQFTVTDRGSPDSCGTPGPLCAAAMTSAPAMVSITVTPINSPPAAAGQSVSTNEDTPLPITLSGSDIETAPASLTYTITQPPAHGTLSGSGGSLTYTPAANYNGTDSFRFTVTDRGDPDNCGSPGLTCAASLTSAAATVSITINAVNDPPSLGVQAYSAVANMKIVLPSGSLLAGAADPDAVDAGFSPVLTVVAGSPATTPGGGAVAIAADGSFSFDPPPGVTGNVTFPYQVCDNGNPMPSQCATGLVTVNVSGPVIWFVAPNLGSNGTGTLASPFNTLTAAAAAAGTTANHRIFVYNNANQAAVVSTALGAGVTLSSGQWLAGQSVVAPGFDTFMGITPPVTTVARPLVNGAATTIQGTVTLSGNNGVVRGVTIQPPAGAKGLAASGPFTGLIAGSGSPGDVAVSTVNARAVDLSGGLNGTFVFKSISVSGGSVADNGIVLNNVNNASGSFAVTGDASSVNNGSGGIIQGTQSHAVSLINTKNVSFDQMNIQAPGDSGVNGTAITNLAFTNGTVANAGNAGYESAIALNGSGSGLGNNINGTLTVTGNTFINPYYSGLDAQSDAGTVTVADISNNVITNPGYIGVNLVGTGNAVTSFSLFRATIDQNNISSAGTGVQVNIGNSNASGPGSTAGSLATPADIISITNNSITIDPTGTQSIIVSNSGGNGASRSRTNFVIRCNGTNTGGCTASAAGALNGSSIGTVIGVGNNGYADMTGTVDNNVIDANHTPGGGGGNGIGGGNGTVLGNAATPNLTLTVTNNTITRTDGNGILLVGRGTSGFANLKIAGNNVGAPLGGARPGIRVDAGNASSLDDGICLNIAGNTSAGSGGVAGIGVRKQGTLPDTNDFGLFNIPQALPANDEVTAFINGTNTSTGGVLVLSGSGFKQCTTAPI